MGGAGVQTNAYAIGGQDPAASTTTSVAVYDGTSWSTQPSLGSANNKAGATGTGSSNLLGFGGYVAAAQEFTPESTALNIKTVSTS